MTDPLLEVTNLSTHFKTRRGTVVAVNDVSFSLGVGDTLGVVGESGCGKSVTALSIMRLVNDPPGRIASGSVQFEGQDLLKLSEEEMQQVRGARIAMIFQDPMTSLNPVLTIGFQMTEMLELHAGLRGESAKRRAAELLEMVGIPAARSRLDDYPHHFSGGMRQRVMIAMAMSCNPRLLIADEPSTALDVTIQAQILDLLRQLTRERDTAVMLITHNLGVVAGYCRRTQVMYAGRIVETALTSDLFADPRHPYTLGLLLSVPRLDDDERSRLVSVRGQPPDLIDQPPGCPFVPRCDWAMEVCRREEPRLKAVEDLEGRKLEAGPVPEPGTGSARSWKLDHLVACWADVRSAPPGSVETSDAA
jgi:oligopeptide transport system ATP-binding protein